MKDNFSTQSDKYAQYRPGYPAEFYEYLNSIVPAKQAAWECGTGNGQVAFELAKTFDKVYATDISQSQLDNALQAENIAYSVQPAESTNFADQQFNLIITAQAIHWFDFERFYAEVRRTAKVNALLCVLGYGRIEISEPIDQLITSFYKDVIGDYWDKERRYIDENYQTIPFPFTEIQTPLFENKLQWDLDHVIGYLNTWSAVKHFIKQNGYNPIDKLQNELEQHWHKHQTREVRFPLLLRIGQVKP
ncbi:class I SAM-dependent methyltransferase [uncultured Pontibacter sp.]|uniref:class I SAM-dependent methyltransferase n=1 Tax=uncultured Pontibacter sp. TaxID=453356 RepID=UPI0026366D93|nr:class I SAM-dependent methyltransferase [uncultured Pontibacter sp.]